MPTEPPEGLLEPDRTTLLVVDKQRAYLDPEVSVFLEPEDGPRLSRRVAAMDRCVRAAHTRSIPVVWTRMTEDVRTSPANLARVMRGESICVRGTPAWNFAGVTPEPDETVIDKQYPSAFDGTQLASVLRRSERSSVVIIGALAGRCVLATAFSAVGAGYDVIVPPDLVVGHDDQPAEEGVTQRIVASAVGWTPSEQTLLDAWT